MSILDVFTNGPCIKVEVTEVAEPVAEVKLYAGHSDVPRLSNEALVEKAYQLMAAIEKCGASPELTTAVTLADELYQHLKKPISLELSV